jgi:cystathionine beta-synthase
VAPHTRPYADVLETIGWTPLIRLNKVTRGLRTPVYVKAEFFNPGGSVKDRIGVAMIEAAEREGRLKPGGLIVEATSGNTGVGLALAAAVKGYRCIFTMPDKMSQEKARLLRALGAEVIITPTAVPPDHPDNYIMKGRAIAAAHDNAIFADQHYNPVNPEVHYRTTGPEIWEQTDGKVTHFVCAPGTGGTVSGAGRYLKEKNPKVRVVAGDPVGSIYTEYARTHQKGEGQPYKVEGIGGDKIPTSLHFDVIDEWVFVTDKDAMAMARRLAKEEGLFVGGSTGVNVVSALEVARRLDDPNAFVVTVLADTGERYLSKVYNEEWLRENELVDDERPTVGRLVAAKNSDAPPLIHVAPEASVRQALNLMSTYNVSQLPVLDGGDGVGAVSEQALMARAIGQPKVLDSPVREVMDPPFPVVDSQSPVAQLATLLSRTTPAALVRRDGTVVGIVTRYDLLHQLAGIR